MKTGKLIGAGVISAIAASLCCLAPALVLLGGSGSIASSFARMEPARPYLIGLTILAISLAWYRKLKPPQKRDCDCSTGKKTAFFQSRIFLLAVTLFAAVMITFPLYANVFFPENAKTVFVAEKPSIQTVVLSIRGMGCQVCEAEIARAIDKLPGIIAATVSYTEKNAVVSFDASKTTAKDITNAITASGYPVTGQSFKN